MWELWGCGDPTRNQLASLTANISIRILSSSDPEPDWSGVQDTAGMTSDVHTGLSPPSDISVPKPYKLGQILYILLLLPFFYFYFTPGRLVTPQEGGLLLTWH